MAFWFVGDWSHCC